MASYHTKIMNRIYSHNMSENQKLKYIYNPENEYSPTTHQYYGAISQVLHLLHDKKNLVIAEIGTFNACSAEAVLQYCDIKKMYIIDPFDMNIANHGNRLDPTNQYINNTLYDTIRTKLNKFEDKLVYLREVSNTAHTKILDEELDFIFIDGCHTFDGVCNDIKNYYPKVKIGGIMAGDDFSNKFKHHDINVIDAVNDTLFNIGYREIDLHKHSYHPKDYYSAFSIVKTI